MQDGSFLPKDRLHKTSYTPLSDIRHDVDFRLNVACDHAVDQCPMRSDIHDRHSRDITLALPGTQQAPQSGILQLRVRAEQLVKHHVLNSLN